MYRGHTVGVIVPAYNEEAHVGTVLETMPEFVDRVYAVDDCSSDGTWDVIRRYASERMDDPEGSTSVAATDASAGTSSIADGGTISGTEIVPIRHERNRGAGGALRTGYLRARDDGVDLVVTMDADGQMDPDDMPALLDPLVADYADYAKGNRLASREDWIEMPPFRLVGNWLLTALTKIASGYWRTTDPQNGYTAITHEALTSIDAERIRDDHDYCNDLLVRLNVAGARIADVSMAAVYRDEESTIDYPSFVPTTSLTLARGFCWRMKRRYLAEGVHPIAVLYGVGFSGALLGAVAGLGTVGASLVGYAPHDRSIEAMRAITVSGLLVVSAMVLDARADDDLEVRCE